MDPMEVDAVEIDAMDVDVMEEPEHINKIDAKQSSFLLTTSVQEIQLDEAPVSPRLLQLPNEILQLILRHTPVRTFFTCLLTCKHVLRVAKSRSLLTTQLGRLPGLRLGLDELEVDELLHLFQRRAAESGHAAGLLANVSRYQTDDELMMAKAVTSRHEQARPHSRYTTLAVPSRSGMIQLFEVTKRLLRKRELLEIHNEDGNPGEISIIKMAFSPGTKDLAVLCSQEPCPDVGSLPHSDPSRYKDAAVYKLVVFHRLFAKQKSHFYCSSQQETRDVYYRKTEKVLDLSLSPNGSACIVWNNESSKRSLVWLIGRNSELMESSSYDPKPRLTTVVPPSAPMHGLVAAAEFSQDGKVLELYRQGHHLPSWSTDVREGDQLSGVTAANIPVDLERDGNVLLAQRGPTFYCRHSPEARAADVEEPLCRWSELYLIYVDNDSRSPYAQPSIFIALNEVYRDTRWCDHTNNTGAVRAFGHSRKPLALLGGYRQGLSSLGTLIAISPNGTRIAAAVWDHIYFWSFNPKMLSEGNLDVYFPPQDYNERKDIGRLRPTLLSTTAGIVHSLAWASEDDLYAITDRGLSKFDINYMCDGRRDEQSLVWDTWSTTALSEVAPGTRDETIPATLSQDTDI